jgi:predicted HicB family RNase H-like nuclease
LGLGQVDFRLADIEERGINLSQTYISRFSWDNTGQAIAAWDWAGVSATFADQGIQAFPDDWCIYLVPDEQVVSDVAEEPITETVSANGIRCLKSGMCIKDIDALISEVCNTDGTDTRAMFVRRDQWQSNCKSIVGDRWNIGDRWKDRSISAVDLDATDWALYVDLDWTGSGNEPFTPVMLVDSIRVNHVTSAIKSICADRQIAYGSLSIRRDSEPEALSISGSRWLTQEIYRTDSWGWQIWLTNPIQLFPENHHARTCIDAYTDTSDVGAAILGETVRRGITNCDIMVRRQSWDGTTPTPIPGILGAEWVEKDHERYEMWYGVTDWELWIVDPVTQAEPGPRPDIRELLNANSSKGQLTHRGYTGQATVDFESSAIFGRLIGIRDVVTYQGDTIAESVQAFVDSVDDYINCKGESTSNQPEPKPLNPKHEICIKAVLSTAHVHKAISRAVKERCTSPYHIAVRRRCWPKHSSINASEWDSKLYSKDFDDWELWVADSSTENQKANIERSEPDAVASVMRMMKSLMQINESWAWGWHCNLAMMAYDAGANSLAANKQAAQFMMNAFGIDMNACQLYRDIIASLEVQKTNSIKASSSGMQPVRERLLGGDIANIIAAFDENEYLLIRRAGWPESRQSMLRTEWYRYRVAPEDWHQEDWQIWVGSYVNPPDPSLHIVPTTQTWADSSGNPDGAVSAGIGFLIHWQRGPLTNGRNGAFMIEVVESLIEMMKHHQANPKFACNENAVAIHLMTEAVSQLNLRRSRRSDAGTLGTHIPETNPGLGDK